ncbi:MAG: RHS repeat-associated core domain-containing protein, partial [Actinomycetota bacterium]
GGPALALSQTKVYWASYNDYLSRQLSIDYRATNNGPGAAYEARVTGATATKGVYLTTPVPLPLGDISQGSYAPFTLKYFVPAGVTGFTTTVYATAKDQAGTDYYYPAKISTYAYNAANQLTSLSDGAGTTAFTYNSAGALSQKSRGEEQTTYNYNGMDKPTQVTTPTATATYAYDALGRRIGRTEGTETANYHLNGKSDLEDYQTDQTGALTASYQRGPDGLISETDHTGQSPVTSYHLYNPHGDTAALTDQNGAVTQNYRYDAFGNATAGDSPRNGYTGKWQRDSDGATGTIRMGVREYDPSLGRFTSADPLKGSITDPQQRNRYTYTSNNPLVRYDLNG